MIQKAV